MKTKLDELMQDPEFRKEYAVEGLLEDAAEMIWQLLSERKMKQADLARLLGKTPAYVSQLLNGKANLTVRTLGEVVYALGAIVKIKSVDEQRRSQSQTQGSGECTFNLRGVDPRFTSSNRFPFVGAGAQGACPVINDSEKEIEFAA